MGRDGFTTFGIAARGVRSYNGNLARRLWLGTNPNMTGQQTITKSPFKKERQGATRQTLKS